jgi:hypothetical protein
MTRRVMSLPNDEARPAFYARTGYPLGDFLALLHPPYTAWHISYVVYGASIAVEVDLVRLAGTMAAFFFGTGIAAHSLDEWHSRPLKTKLSDGALLLLAAGGLAASLAIAVAGTFAISPWVLAWAAGGTVLAAGYTLEWHRLLHSDLTFGLAWGGFPVLVGYWAQTEHLVLAPLLIAMAATLLSLVQRSLSKPARYVRRNSLGASVLMQTHEGAQEWPRERLLASWEAPLKLLSATTILLAIGLLVATLSR